MTLLQMGMLGGPEILIIFLVAVILLGIPLLVVLGVASGLSVLGADDEEIDALRERIDELEAQLAAESDETVKTDEKVESTDED
ncbi:MAG: hypothetical protein ABEI77_10815 [Halorientalis sp.]